jgi:hypothetical protein
MSTAQGSAPATITNPIADLLEPSDPVVAFDDWVDELATRPTTSFEHEVETWSSRSLVPGFKLRGKSLAAVAGLGLILGYAIVRGKSDHNPPSTAGVAGAIAPAAAAREAHSIPTVTSIPVAPQADAASLPRQAAQPAAAAMAPPAQPKQIAASPATVQSSPPTHASATKVALAKPAPKSSPPVANAMLSSGPRGVLMISTKPPCEIIVDGKPTHLTTPQRSLPLTAGSHQLTLINTQQKIRKQLAVNIDAHHPTKLIEDFLKH